MTMPKRKERRAERDNPVVDLPALERVASAPVIAPTEELQLAPGRIMRTCSKVRRPTIARGANAS